MTFPNLTINAKVELDIGWPCILGKFALFFSNYLRCILYYLKCQKGVRWYPYTNLLLLYYIARAFLVNRCMPYKSVRQDISDDDTY